MATSTASSTQTANSSASSNQVATSLPFSVASRLAKRQSFALTNVSLASASPTVPAGSPVQVPAVGYLQALRLEFTGTVSGGTSPALVTGDTPWNVISSIAVTNSAGQNLIAPMTGYELYLINKYGFQGAGLAAPIGALQDPKNNPSYSASGSGFHFFLDLPFTIDQRFGMGAIPALASNRSYNVQITYNSIANVYSGAPNLSVTVDATAVYWEVPVSTTPGGVQQVTTPYGGDTLSLWQKETALLTQGENTTKSSNVGNVIRNIILVARDSTGNRLTFADWSNVVELYLDNNPLIREKKTEWLDELARQYGYIGTSDAAGGLDSGVFVFPFALLAGGNAGDPSSSKAQYLPTLDATLMQLKGNAWGAGAAGGTLTIITQAVTTSNIGYIYGGVTE